MTTPQRPRAHIDPSPALTARLERSWNAPRRGARLPPRTTPTVVGQTPDEEDDDGS